MSTGIELPPPPPPPPTALADAEFSLPPAAPPLRTCPNCGAPAHGPFCYACGQSEKGMIRHLSEVMADLADIVFNVDSRIFRSLGDLYFRPGYLTTEYLAGRRARYVTPFRLFFFLTVIAFFAIQSMVPESAIRFDDDAIAAAETPEQVSAVVDRTIAEMTTAKSVPGLPRVAIEGIEKGMQEVRDRGAERITELGKETAAGPVEGSSPTGKKKGKKNIQFDVDGQPWDAETNPVRVDWLPDGINRWINHTLTRMDKNVENARKDPGRLLAGWFAVLPQTLFVVMPLFAVLLKVFYIFRRRLYMEHLLVALHSHAFIFLSVLVILLLGLLHDFAGAHAWLADSIGLLRALAWIWLFLYLLLMQKRIYRQGWFMTTLKYCVIGFCYTIFLSVALAFSALVSLALT